MIEVIAIDTTGKRHVAERLSAAEYAEEGPEGCAHIARVHCREHGLKFANFDIDIQAANAADLCQVRLG